MNSFIPQIQVLGSSLTVALVILTTGGNIVQAAIAGGVTSLMGIAALNTQKQNLQNKISSLENQVSQQQQLSAIAEKLAQLENKTVNQCQSLQNSISNLETKLNHRTRLIAIEMQIRQITNTLLSGQNDNTGKANQTHPEIIHTIHTEVNHHTNDQNKVVSFLASRGISIKFIPTDSLLNSPLDSLAYFLGENYTGLAELLKRIKQNMQRGTEFTLSIKEYPQKDISNVCNFCDRLFQIAYLEEYRYLKAPQCLVKARPTTLPNAQNFFSGKWLESYVLQVVQECIAIFSSELQIKLEFTYLTNAQVILANGDDFELDLVCCIDDTFVWIEAKSGNFQQHINKYAKVAKMMNLDPKHSVMVLCDINSINREFLSTQFAMTVCSIGELHEVVMNLIREDILVKQHHLPEEIIE